MKKIFIFSLILLIPFFTKAETCPFGLENDPAPGSCARFIDENQNNLCDLSEIPLDVKKDVSDEVKYVSGEELKKYTVAQVAEMYGIAASDYANALAGNTKREVGTSNTLQYLHDEYGLCSGVAGSIALDLKNKVGIRVQTEQQVEDNQERRGKESFEVLPITLGVLILYVLTYLLYKKNKISLVSHRRIWNVALLFSFIVCGLTGILLVIRIEYGWAINFGLNLSKFHVQSGIIMTLISLFHVLWHTSYYSCMFKRVGKCDENEK